MTSYEDCPICQTDTLALRSYDLPVSNPSWPVMNVADLFSGCGGLSLGIQRAAHHSGYSIDVRLALDSDPIAMNVYNDLFPTANPVCDSIEKVLDGEIGAHLTETETELVLKVGDLDFMLGGPPCQGHSNLNNHSRRDDPRNGLYLRMARAAEVFKPTAIIMENVPTVTYDVQKAVHRTIDCLKSLKYAVGEGVVDLSNLGVPQSRRRHIIIALQKCEVNAQELVDSLQSPICEHVPRTVRWAIEDLEDDEKATVFDSASIPYPINQSRIDWLFDHDRNDLPNKLRPPCHRSDHSYPAMYGRMDWDLPAQTVTTGFNCMGQGRYVHPSRRRVITPHEAARLQTLPDYVNFRSVPTRKHLAKLIGNSVPPLLSFAIGKTVIPLLKNLRSSSNEPRTSNVA
ncbi:MAG: DNA cytosine methyltransferase [Gemmatimonadetes bacterium]|nr:DNA cytosine methyltransferase [Gemmatimonadota bacterium]